MNQSKKSHTENSNNNNSTAKEELPSSVVSRSFNWLTHKRKSFSLYHFDIMAPPVGIKLKKSKNPKWKVGKKIGAGACASVHELLELDGTATDFAIKLAPLPTKTTRKQNSPAEVNARLLYFEQLMYNNQFPDMCGKTIPKLPPYGGPPVQGEEEGRFTRYIH